MSEINKFALLVQKKQFSFQFVPHLLPGKQIKGLNCSNWRSWSGKIKKCSYRPLYFSSSSFPEQFDFGSGSFQEEGYSQVLAHSEHSSHRLSSLFGLPGDSSGGQARFLAGSGLLRRGTGCLGENIVGGLVAGFVVWFGWVVDLVPLLHLVLGLQVLAGFGDQAPS